ncbi:TldD/PmbA family protein [Candidatus Woesearchaeota archaeon]|nr:TldD/PmbA family protein [Candidatus Woesearchaeota archaeon]
MFDKLNHFFGKQDNNLRYWDFNSESLNSETMIINNLNINLLNKSFVSGFSIRVLYKNAWGFSFSNNSDDLLIIAKKALENAKSTSLYTKRKVEINFDEVWKDDAEFKMKKNPFDISLDEKKKVFLNINRQTLNFNKKIKSSEIGYRFVSSEKEYCNSLGSEIKQKIPETYFGISLTAKDGDKVQSYPFRVALTKGYEVLDNIYPRIDEAKKQVIKLLNAETPKGGKYNVVCDGGMTAVFIHEALGHATEADSVLQGGSCLKGKLGKKIASEYVEVHDQGNIDNDYGGYIYDDEGVKAKDNILIKKGVLVKYLTSRDTSKQFNLHLSGNARIDFPSFHPIVRMSNTYIKEGEYKVDELLKEMKEGIYLKGSYGGAVDTLMGNFQFSAVEGYKISKGEIKEPLKMVTLGGKVLETLHNIQGISDKRDKDFPGHCGKRGQSVRTGGYNPHIWIKKAYVGGK